MRHKVLVDTCVLLAASTCSASSDIGVSIKHKFYDECSNLFSLFEKNLSKRIGIITTTVENEASSVLMNVIEDELTKITIADKSREFEALSFCLNACEDRMHKLSSLLLREPISEMEFQKYYITVCNMYSEIENKARDTLPANFVSKLKIRGTPPRFRRLSVSIYKGQEWEEREQLTRLFSNPVENSDKKILAEAMYLQSVYRETESGVELLLASTDYHFSPMIRSGGESRPVTNAIKSQCGITCDWPNRIAELIHKELT